MKDLTDITTLTDEAVGLLEKLIATPSFSHEEQGTAMILQTALQQRHIPAQRIMNNVWALNRFYDPVKPTILLNSHHDTVRPNSQYTLDPFHPLIQNGQLYGLGSNDAGASLVSLLAAFLYFYDREDLRYNLVFAGTAEEEISGSNGIEALLAELGNIDCAIVGEPTGMQMAIAEKGLLVLDCIVKGQAGHAAREEGENAIYKSLADIAWFQSYRFPKVSQVLGPVKMSLTMISAGVQHNVVPAECRFTVDVRVNDCYSHEEILDIIKAQVACTVTPRSMRLRATAIDAGHPLVLAGESLGLDHFGSATMSDKALMPFPALKIGPGESARSHAADEYVLLTEIEDGIQTYIRLLEKILLPCIMKLWQKEGTQTAAKTEQFTVGRDREFDLLLARYDVIGSLAHTAMLQKVGLLSEADYADIKAGLEAIAAEIEAGAFGIDEDAEDIHSKVEQMLTQRIGEAGKKIHSGRSRNDQVALDIKLYLRDAVLAIKEEVGGLFDLLLTLSDRFREVLMPGYTHLQVAMPSSFGLWFGAYAECLAEDMEMLAAAYAVINKNPLGSGAGYGSSFPLDRAATTKALGFRIMHYNAINAQMSRGRSEKMLAMALSCIAATLSRLAMDVCLYNSQNFGFISFPESLTTGSSIMPHKKNPDIFELIRGKCNRIQALPNELSLLLTNLPSGYHRELQLTKEILFPGIDSLRACIDILMLALPQAEVNTAILDDERYRYIFSVEAVNELVKEGMPFRDAYRQVGKDIAEGHFQYTGFTASKHTHEGSIGQLCNDKIRADWESVTRKFS